MNIQSKIFERFAHKSIYLSSIFQIILFSLGCKDLENNRPVFLKVAL